MRHLSVLFLTILLCAGMANAEAPPLCASDILEFKEDLSPEEQVGLDTIDVQVKALLKEYAPAAEVEARVVRCTVDGAPANTVIRIAEQPAMSVPSLYEIQVHADILSPSSSKEAKELVAAHEGCRIVQGTVPAASDEVTRKQEAEWANLCIIAYHGQDWFVRVLVGSGLIRSDDSPERMKPIIFDVVTEEYIAPNQPWDSSRWLQTLSHP